MSFKFIHTSDWQIGKVFRFVNQETMGILQEARLNAISRIGEIAAERGIRHVLVAGDVYDVEQPKDEDLGRPVERMRSARTVQWHLLPGNHDPHRPEGLWARLQKRDIPDNVHFLLEQKPALLEDERAALLPAPLFHKRTLNDPAEYMKSCETPEGFVRIGIGHGTVVSFSSSPESTPNLIAEDHAERANLAYMALGDWHGQRQISSRCWYSGTPETDAFDVDGGGQALVVEIDGPAAIPKVEPVPVGSYEWHVVEAKVSGRNEIDELDARLRSISKTPSRMLVNLKVSGTLSLRNHRYFAEKIQDGLSAAFCFLQVHDGDLLDEPTSEDLDQIGVGGYIRDAVDRLRQKAESGSGEDQAIARDALRRLYVEWMKRQA